VKVLRRGDQSGFTIVEVVLAMGILLVGAAAILSMLTFGASLTRAAQLRTAAAAAVEAVRADIETHMFLYDPSMDGETGEVGAPVDLVDRAVPGLKHVVYSATATQNPDPDLAREHRVDVDIRWTSGGVQRNKQITWIFLQEISFGERLRRRFVEKSGTLPGQQVE
jgi:prepilin-type N-terminal cleavage/methylation domain-containing protein